MIGGVEGGGTRFVCAVAEDPAAPLERLEVPTEDPTRTLARCREFLAGFELEALGVACFGPLGLDPGRADHGRLLRTPKAGWSGTDVLGGLRPRADLPVALDTDVHGAALAELHLGAGRGARDLVYVTVGTGVGVGVLVDGRPVHGVLHPEAGHLRTRRAPGDAFPGTCPFHGDCWEGLVSGPAIAARAGRPAHELADDDPAWEPVLEDLAEGLAQLHWVLAPERLVLGGGVGRRPHLLRALPARLRARLASYVPADRLEPLEERLVAPGLGADAGVRGGLLLARRALADAGADAGA